MNKLTIIGNLTRDVELRTASNGKNVASFTVAVNRRSKTTETADYFRVSAWNGLAETCHKYLAKGRKVCVVGAVSCRTYTGSDGTTHASMEVMADDVEFLSAPQQGTQPAQPAQEAQPQPQTEYVQVNMTEDLPF